MTLEPEVIVEELPYVDESSLDRTFVAGASDWRFNTYEQALRHAILTGTTSSPSRVHKEADGWYSSRSPRQKPIPTGPWPSKRRAR